MPQNGTSLLAWTSFHSSNLFLNLDDFPSFHPDSRFPSHILAILQSRLARGVELIGGIFRMNTKQWTGFYVYSMRVEVNVTGSDLDARTG